MSEPLSSNPVDLAEIERLRGLLVRVDELVMRERQSNKGYVREIRKTIRQALHRHTHKCWEPDSGCDMGRNEKYVARVTDETSAPPAEPL